MTGTDGKATLGGMTTTASATLPTLRRVRWAIRAVLTLGVAASVAANILHAHDNPISQTIAGWPPVALLITIEVMSRVPVHTRSWAAVRIAATGTIAGIAAWVSYWHMAGVAARYGETGASPYLLPLSVDGLVVVASVSLVELAGRIRAASEAPDMTTAPDMPQVTAPVMSVVPAAMAPDIAPVTEPDTAASAPDVAPVRPVVTRTVPAPAKAARKAAPEPDTATAIAAVRAKEPDLTQAEVAALVGKSERTVARHWAATAPDKPKTNGHSVPDLLPAGSTT